MAVILSDRLFACPLCRQPLKTNVDGNRLTCAICQRSANIAPGSGRLDFGDFLDHTATIERERVGLAYRFYAMAYAPLALLNMLTVWRASLGKLIRHYATALSGDSMSQNPIVQVNSAPILDIAVGDGALTQLTLRRCNEHLDQDLFCLDIADDMLIQAERNLAGRRNLRTIRADAGALPFAEGTFSRVCCYGGLHVIAHPERAAREMRRVLQPGGLFSASILLTPPGPVAGYLARRYVELGFLSTNFTRASALALLQDEGFTDLRPEDNGHMLLVTGRARDE